MLRHFTLLIFGLAFSSGLIAQVTTSSMNGRVIDTDKVGLIGATIQAVHTPTGTTYGTAAQSDGYYSLANMRVGGPYTLTVSYIGYQDKTVEGIYLQLGEKRNLDFALLEDAETLSEVVVSANQNSPINSERTGAATSISSQQLQNLPTISRSAADFTRLTPSSDGNSFAGRNDQYNNFTLDGSIFNNPFGLDAATAGGQTNAQPISLDAIDQITVNLAPYDVTQAGFTGAAVNAVTKSGTNEFHGTAFAFYRNQDLTGSRVSGNEIFVPELSQLQTGASIGGPIIKNKLFFFANFELERREDLGSNFIAGRPGLSGDQVSRVQAADLDLVSSVLLERFGYETGAYEGYLHNTDNQKGLFKLDFNLNTNNTLTLTYNFLDASRDNNAHPSALGRRGPDATTLQFFNSGYEITNKIQSGILEWRSVFGDKVSNQFQAGITAYRDSRNPFSAPFPSILIQESGINYIVTGHEPFSVNNRLNQDLFQISNNLQIFTGRHTITVGASLERFEFDNSFNLGFYDGAFGPFLPGASSVQAFADSVRAGAYDDIVAAAQGTFDALNGTGEGFDGTGWSLAETNVGQLAFYIQDEIDVTDRFKLTVGLRADRPLYFDTDEKIQENIDRNCCYDPSITYYDETGEPIMFDHTELPTTQILWSPRFGFNFDVRGDRTLQLRGGSGLFSGRFPFVWLGNQVANPNFFFYTVTDPDFQFPQVWRTNFGGDLAFGEGWLFTTDLIYTKDVNSMIVRNFGLITPEGSLEGVDNRPVYRAEDRGAANAYVFTNTDLGSSFNASFELKRNWPGGLYTSLGYNFLDAREASSIEAEISSDAYERNPAFGNVNQAMLSPSLYGNRHRFVGSASKRFEYGQMATTISVFFQYAEGGRFSYTYSGDINNDGSGLNDLIYIPTSGDLSSMTFSGTTEEQQEQRRALNSFIQQDKYLSERRGQYAERYSILSPWFNNWDIRIAQDLKIGDSGNIFQFTIDILNIGNLIDSDWGVRQFPTNTQPIGVAVVNNEPVYSFDTSLTDSFFDDFSLLSRWQMQLGLRYRF
ncbi:MAG: carboxypeptidase regulatory-like domain-containing protein [Bacteroidota bacterium]